MMTVGSWCRSLLTKRQSRLDSEHARLSRLVSQQRVATAGQVLDRLSQQSSDPFEEDVLHPLYDEEVYRSSEGQGQE